jgi:LPPG:FO 2-phospho-L-lactate transferase
VTVLTGGVGGARFLRGLSALIDPAALTVIGNTADDDEFFGLHVSPDLDTALYTLAGRADRRQGWGVAGDSFACLATLADLGSPAWFRLGDRDLATHVLRTEWLRRGLSLSEVTRRLARAHRVQARLLPMTNARVRTIVHTPAGPLSFQAYLVRDRARHRVRRITFTGARRAAPAPGVLAALRRSSLVVIAPSNPLVSIGPMLAMPALRRALAQRRALTVAISPLVGGRAVRGPLHRMLRGLGLPANPATIARLYRGLIDVLVLDHRDAAAVPAVEALGVRAVVTETVMATTQRARHLAATVLHALDRPAPR